LASALEPGLVPEKTKKLALALELVQELEPETIPVKH
jgi:hypothetical protein